MPLHPLGRTWAETLREDREAVILADRLGFHDAFIGEHLTDQPREHHQQPAVPGHADLRDPADPARHRARRTCPTSTRRWWRPTRRCSTTCPTAGSSSASARARCPRTPRCSASSTRTATRCSPRPSTSSPRSGRREPPYDIDLPGQPLRRLARDDRSTRSMGVGIAAQAAAAARVRRSSAPSSRRSPRASSRWAQQGLPPAVGQLPAAAVGGHALAATTSQGKEAAGPSRRPGGLADRPHRLRRRRRGTTAPCVRPRRRRTAPTASTTRRCSTKMTQARPAGAVQDAAATSPTSEVTLERVLDDLVITGTADEVAEQLVAFREQIGDFGELVYAGLDWVDEGLARRSMELMARGHAARREARQRCVTGCPSCRRRS